MSEVVVTLGEGACIQRISVSGQISDFQVGGWWTGKRKPLFIKLQKYHGKLKKKSHSVGSTKVEYNDPKVCQGVWDCSHTACGKQEGRSEEDFLFSFHAICNCGVLSYPQEDGWATWLESGVGMVGFLQELTTPVYLFIYMTTGVFHWSCSLLEESKLVLLELGLTDAVNTPVPLHALHI